jgi:hypothetical protein
MFFSEYFNFSLSVSVHQRSTRIFILILLLSEGQAGEVWEPSDKAWEKRSIFTLVFFLSFARASNFLLEAALPF